MALDFSVNTSGLVQSLGSHKYKTYSFMWESVEDNR